MTVTIEVDGHGGRFAVRREKPDTGPEGSRVRLARIGGEWVVCAEETAGDGAVLNGERLRGRVRLRDRDVVRVGGLALVFERTEAPRGPRSTPAAAGEVPDVTPAEHRVLVALTRPWAAGRGLAGPPTNREIAAELVLSVHTVKSHLRSLFAKFKLTDLPQSRKRAALVDAAARTNLVDGAP